MRARPRGLLRVFWNCLQPIYTKTSPWSNPQTNRLTMVLTEYIILSNNILYQIRKWGAYTTPHNLENMWLRCNECKSISNIHVERSLSVTYHQRMNMCMRIECGIYLLWSHWVTYHLHLKHPQSWSSLLIWSHHILPTPHFIIPTWTWWNWNIWSRFLESDFYSLQIYCDLSRLSPKTRLTTKDPTRIFSPCTPIPHTKVSYLLRGTPYL